MANNEVIFNVNPTGERGPDGTVTLKPGPGVNETTIVVELSGVRPETTHVNHFHLGNLKDGGPIRFPLKLFSSDDNGLGRQETVLGIPISFLTDGNHFFAIHEELEGSRIIASGDVPKRGFLTENPFPLDLKATPEERARRIFAPADRFEFAGGGDANLGLGTGLKIRLDANNFIDLSWDLAGETFDPLGNKIGRLDAPPGTDFSTFIPDAVVTPTPAVPAPAVPAPSVTPRELPSLLEIIIEDPLSVLPIPDLESSRKMLVDLFNEPRKIIGALPIPSPVDISRVVETVIRDPLGVLPIPDLEGVRKALVEILKQPSRIVELLPIPPSPPRR